MGKIAVLVPCYNESLTIEKVIMDYKKALPEADIFVYDNNSSDHTDEIARNAGAIVRYEYRQGKNQIAYKEQNVSFMEPQNWIKKGGLFLKRKFFGK